MTEPISKTDAPEALPAGRVFVSYASVDRAHALATADALEQAGFGVWIDRRGIAGGTAWAEEIAVAVRGCAALALLVTPASVASRNVRQELQLAWDHDRPILPMILEHVVYPDAVAYFLHGRQWVELVGRAEADWLPEAVAALRDMTGEGPARPAGSPVPPPAPAPPTNLPAQATSLVGRESVVEAARGILERGEARLVTLTGPGGTGKTRIGLQVAADLTKSYPDGVWFVPLAPVASSELVLNAIATALGVRETGGEPLIDTLLDHLRNRRLLLVLDNFEHVTAAARTVGALLAGAPRLDVLATSRAALRVYGEREVAVPPLSLPPTKRLPPLEELLQFEAVALFVERARAVVPAFALTDANAAAVAEICVHLEGLPLAIELAAARVRVLPPSTLLARLSSRLKVLTGGAVDRDPRQQTLRGAIAWSNDLLAPSEQRLFHRLAVFAGCSFEAAEAVNGATGDPDVDVLDGLESLVAKSLLRQEVEDPDGGWSAEPRFRMLETLREFGLEQLEAKGEADPVRDAHAAYYLGLAEQAESELTGEDQATWLARLEAEHDNLRAALARMEAADRVAEAMRLAGALWRFWWVHGHLSEGRRTIEGILARGDERGVPPDADAVFGAGVMAHYQGDLNRAGEHYERALALYRERDVPLGVARALSNLGTLARDQGAYERAETRLQEALALCRELGDERGVSICLSLLGTTEFVRGRFERAAAFFEEYLAISRRRRDQHSIAYALLNLAEACEYQGDLDRAESLLREVLPLFEDLGDDSSRADALCSLGRVALARGDAARAGDLLREGLAVFEEAGEKASVARCLEGLAAAAGANDDPILAARLFGAAEALREAIAAPLADAYLDEHDRHVSAIQSAIGWPIFSAAWEEGRALDYAAAVAEAMTAPPTTATA